MLFRSEHTVLSLFPFWFSGKYLFQPQKKINPYISGGIFIIAGNIYPTEGEFRYHGHSRAGLHLGCGFDYFLRKDIAFNADLKLPVGAPGFDGVRINFGAKYFFEPAGK